MTNHNPHATNAPRLNVGIISAGKVGVAVGQALSRAGHRVVGIAARSVQSQQRANLRLPEAPILPIADVAARAELIVIAVSDPAIADVARQIAPHVGAGRIVMHTAGSLGRAVLDDVALTGALTIAAHPAMTFAGLDDDADRLIGCPWGVTVGDELAKTVAELIIGEMGGRPFFVAENQRGLYHAAMAHGSNNLGAVVADAVELLAGALVGTADYTDDAQRDQAAALLGPLLEASLHNTLKWGPRALTGPVVRDDVGTVVKHEHVIEQTLPGAKDSYRALAKRIAELRGSTEVLKYLADS